MTTKTAQQLAEDIKEAAREHACAVFCDAGVDRCADTWSAFVAAVDRLASLAQASQARTDEGAWQQLVKLAQAEFAFPDMDFDGSPDIPAWASLVHKIDTATPPGNATQAAGAQCISVEDRLPVAGTDCLVWVKALNPLQSGPTHYAYVTRWDEQHEAPVSFSSVTIPVGLGWDDFDYEDVTHWMPLPQPPKD